MGHAWPALLRDGAAELEPDGGIRRTARRLHQDGLRASLIAAAKATENDAPSYRRVAFLCARLEFTPLSAEAQRLADAIDGGAKADTQAVNALMERRWQMMRAILKSHPLAVNVRVIATADLVLNRTLGWKGPSDAAKSGKLQLQLGDDWLNEDQSATRNQSGRK